MLGPGQRYIRIILTSTGAFTLLANEEVTTAVIEPNGLLILVCGIGAPPKTTDGPPIAKPVLDDPGPISITPAPFVPAQPSKEKQ